MVFCLLTGLCVQGFAGDAGFAPIFNDGVVLQCEMPVNIWGSAKPGETVSVSFAGQNKTALADQHGQWMLQLDPMKASAKPGRLVASFQRAGSTVQISKVQVGEVWLATGQSNMVQPARVTAEGREALKTVHPSIHFSKVPLRVGAPHIPPCTEVELAWGEFGPGHNDLAAVAFHFAEELQPKIGKHVGVIQCSYGGTSIESWMPRELLLNTPGGTRTKAIFEYARRRGYGAEDWKEEIASYNAAKATESEWMKKKQGKRPPKPTQPRLGNPFLKKTPASLYESMTKEIIPYTARGVLWYQGEANVARPDDYVELLSAHIGRVRQDFKYETLPFYIVQLSAWGPGEEYWPEFRAAQARVRDTVPNTGLALSLDVGDELNIHPTNKKPVGRRLAYLALNDIYDLDTPARGPRLKSVEAEGSKMVLTFDHALDGLSVADDSESAAGFEVAGSDKRFVKASASITGKTEITLDAPSVSKPIFARYAWHGFFKPSLNLYNSAGLPAEPFSTE
ncbi:sialate O-acetylesterase [Rhodopirellula sp. SWK7]|uniref:sialate O-acetylesterase n=1 Tax=Rhodopirellula sp. SWK7 TaxID=595460 RepID=UPI001360B4DA|nr:sialate O-acetylesterase [Rhodopirellula sp. SWK7]